MTYSEIINKLKPRYTGDGTSHIVLNETHESQPEFQTRYIATIVHAQTLANTYSIPVHIVFPEERHWRCVTPTLVW